MFKWIMRALVIAVLTLIVIGFAAQSFADHSWGGYHWARTSNPFTLNVGNNVSKEAWGVYLDGAIYDWSVSAVLNLLKKGSGTGSRCQPKAGMIVACSARYGWNGWLGIAQIWVDGFHITQAITRMNDTYFTTSTYNTPPWKQLVMCQELAHAFGLDHQDEIFDNPNVGSCMDYTNDPDGYAGGAVENDPSNEHPNQHDYDQIHTLYDPLFGGHLDSTSTVNNARLPRLMPPAMGQIVFDTPAQWGQLVRSSANRRAQVYELDFGRGHKVITHVFWADPSADAQ